MEVKDIKRLLDAVAAADVDEFSFETGDFKLTVRRSTNGSATLVPESLVRTGEGASVERPAGAPAVSGVIAAPAERLEAPVVGSHLYEVTAPIVGTFYSAPAPEAQPYVKIGDKVEEGAVLCIIEAMKLMNEIEADRAGTVTEILVQNEEPVEYGQALFRIDPL